MKDIIIRMFTLGLANFCLLDAIAQISGEPLPLLAAIAIGAFIWTAFVLTLPKCKSHEAIEEEVSA